MVLLSHLAAKEVSLAIDDKTQPRFECLLNNFRSGFLALFLKGYPNIWLSSHFSHIASIFLQFQATDNRPYYSLISPPSQESTRSKPALSTKQLVADNNLNNNPDPEKPVSYATYLRVLR